MIAITERDRKQMKGAIFDVDGTILDSMNVWGEVAVEFFAMYKCEIDDKIKHEIKEMQLEESFPYLIKLWSLDIEVEDAINTMRKMIINEYKNNIPPKEYVCEYIKKLHNDGVKIAVATSSYRELCESAFKRLGILDYIDAYAFSNEVGCDKSNPDVYLLAAQRIGVNPEDSFVYEDIVSGIEGAKKGGFKTCAVYDASNENETDILKEKADIYIKSWKELL